MPDTVPSDVEIVPLRSEGIEAVTLVRFDAEGLTVRADQTLIFRYVDIAAWPFPAPLRGLMWRLGWRRSTASVGKRHWHTDHQYARIEFFTTPRLTIWMPPEGHRRYATSPWVQFQRRLAASGFCTWDMT
jgi:hypothetical protein